MNAIDKLFAECIVRQSSDLFCSSMGMYVRDRGDIGIIREQSLYKDMLQFKKPGLLLDLGAHIGASVRFFLDNSIADTIISVEPDPSNFNMLVKNWGCDNRVELHQQAVVDDTAQETVPLYLGKTYSSDNSLENFRGRRRIDVPTIQFDELLARRPRAIKCDIEGSEYSLDWAKVPESVTEICMEMHQFRPAWLEQQHVIDNKLLALGFHHVKAPKHDEVFFRRTQIVIWAR